MFRPGPKSIDEADELNDMLRRIAELESGIPMDVVPPLQKIPHAQTHSIFLDEEVLASLGGDSPWIEILSVSWPAGNYPPAFSFKEKQQLAQGVWTDKTDGIYGEVADTVLGLNSSTDTTNTTLTAALDDSVTTLHVTSAAGFPSSGQYAVTIGSEQFLVIGGQGTTTWTAIRNYNGTTAAAHANGATVTIHAVTLSVNSALDFPSSGDYFVTIGDEQLLVTQGQGTGTWKAIPGMNGTTIASHSVDDIVIYRLTAAYHTNCSPKTAPVTWDGAAVPIPGTIVKAWPGFAAAATPTDYWLFEWVETPLQAQITGTDGAGSGTNRYPISASDVTMEVKTMPASFPVGSGFYVKIDDEEILVADVTGGNMTRLASAITSSALSLTNNSTVGFVDSTGWALIGGTEVVKITAGASGTGWTIVRHQNGTQASGHGAGAIVVPVSLWTIARGAHGTKAAAHLADAVVSQVPNGYSFAQKLETVDGGWYAPGDPIVGTLDFMPSFERNGNHQVPTGTTVLLWRGFYERARHKREWIFDYCCTGDNTIAKIARTRIPTGTYNNYPVPDCELWIIICDGGPVWLTGLIFGWPGRRLEVRNDSPKPSAGQAPNSAYLSASDSGSNPLNQFGGANGQRLEIPPQKTANLKHDGDLIILVDCCEPGKYPGMGGGGSGGGNTSSNGSDNYIPKFSDTSTLTDSGLHTDGTRTTSDEPLNLPSGTTGQAPLRIPPGSAPTTPVAGDLWTQGSDLKFRDSSATQTAERLANKNGAGGYAGLDGSSKISSSQIPDLSSTYQATSGKDAANGYAGLDSGGKISSGELPSTAGTTLAGAPFSGTTIDSYVTVFDFNPAKPIAGGYWLVENTGGSNSLKYKVTTTDLNNFSDFTEVTIGPNTLGGANNMVLAIGVGANISKRVKLEIKANSPGNQTTYKAYASGVA